MIAWCCTLSWTCEALFTEFAVVSGLLAVDIMRMYDCDLCTFGCFGIYGLWCVFWYLLLCVIDNWSVFYLGLFGLYLWILFAVFYCLWCLFMFCLF